MIPGISLFDPFPLCTRRPSGIVQNRLHQGDSMFSLERTGLIIQRPEPGDINGFKDYINTAAAATYQDLSIELVREVTPSSGLCSKVCSKLMGILTGGMSITQKEYFKSPMAHYFLIAYFDGKTWLIDPTYKQFILEEPKNKLPAVMIIELTDESTLIQQLHEHKIPERFHKVWIDTVREYLN